MELKSICAIFTLYYLWARLLTCCHRRCYIMSKCKVEEERSVPHEQETLSCDTSHVMQDRIITETRVNMQSAAQLIRFSLRGRWTCATSLHMLRPTAQNVPFIWFRSQIKSLFTSVTFYIISLTDRQTNTVKNITSALQILLSMLTDFM